MKTLTAMKFNQVILLALLLLSGQPIFAAKSVNQQTKTFEKSFATTNTSELHLKNRRGNIQIINIEGNEARVEVQLTVTGKENDEIQKLFDQFELSVKTTGNIIDVISENNIKNWVRINSFFRNSNKIKFNNDIVAQGITEIEVEMILYLPKIKSLQANNKYHDILFSNLPCSLEVDLYSGKLKGENISGDLTLNMKYGAVDIGNFMDGDIDIYDSKFSSGNAQKVKFKSKYSDIELGNLSSFTMDSYDDEMEIGDISEAFEFEAKYTNLKMESFGTSDMDIYDTDVKGKSGKELILRSKYGSFRFENIEDSSLKLYDDEFEAESLKQLKIKSSKYSEISIDKFLGGSVDVISSYEDKIIFSKGIADFESLNFDAKYSTLIFPIEANVKYQLDAKMKYCSLDMSNNFEHTYRDKDNSNIEIKGMANGGGSGNPKITINSYDGKIDIAN